MIKYSVEKLWNNVTLKRNRTIELNDQLIIITFKPVQYYQLDAISSTIWSFLKNKKSLDFCLSYFLKNYDVKENRLKKDIKNFIFNLDKNSLANINNNESKIKKNKSNKSIIQNKSIKKVLEKYYVENKLPYKVFFELTYNCNLKCKHCYLGNDLNKIYNKMTYDRIKKLLKEMKNNGVIELFVTGGEPTLHNQFIEIVSTASKMNFVITILTNGTMLDDDTIKKIIKLNVKDVRISLYGTKKFHNRFVNNKNAFNKSIKSLIKLNNLGNIGTAVTVLNKNNFNNIIELREFLNKNNINHEVSPFIFPTINGNLDPTKLRATQEQLKKLINSFNINVGGNSCGGGLSRFRITPWGEVNPCEMLRNISFGKLSDMSFSELLRSKSRIKWINKMNIIYDKNFKNLNIKDCQSCDLDNYCMNCVGLSNVEKGNFKDHPDYACMLARIQKNILLSEGKNEKKAK